MSDDSDIEIIKARKMMELRKKAAAQEKAKTVKTPKETVLSFLYDRGDEVLKAAYAQYPTQTEAIVNKIAELVAAGEIQQKISGGELLSLFRSIGMRIRLDTSIKIEDHGKMVSFSEKLKQNE